MSDKTVETAEEITEFINESKKLLAKLYYFHIEKYYTLEEDNPEKKIHKKFADNCLFYANGGKKS
ncbi:MAG: hypothetical protein ACOCP4_04715 [Candidatus Woesearchaeota archaeon]